MAWHDRGTETTQGLPRSPECEQELAIADWGPPGRAVPLDHCEQRHRYVVGGAVVEGRESNLGNHGIPSQVRPARKVMKSSPGKEAGRSVHIGGCCHAEEPRGNLCKFKHRRDFTEEA